MPEDQGVNGDRWTNELAKLLIEFGWNKVADSNIDIIGIDKISHGIDSLYWYVDGLDLKRPKGVFLEAKRYATTSFQGKKIEDWVKVLNNKIRELIISRDLFESYPEIEKAIKFNGVLAIWFHDLDNYSAYQEKFIQILEKMHVPRIRAKTEIELNFFILENTKILQMATLMSEVKNLRNLVNDFTFYYPSIGNHASNNLNVLNLEYIFSKFVLAKGVSLNSERIENFDYVFYFGETSLEHFQILISALTKFNFINSNNKLFLYIYKRDLDTFRKIKPDVEKIFLETGLKKIEMKQLNNLSDLPDWMVNN